VQLIQLLLAYQETGLEISHINDLVNQDQPSVDTLKKRRETLLKELRYKLAAKFNIPQEEIFIEQRMVSDKRMKLLFLNKLVVFKI
jgi:DNA-binding transcriptional MerR regulator